jgi:ribosomal-protein-alanine N-acetyltransferase
MFRKMVKADVPQLLVIEQSVQGAPWTEETFKTCFEMAYEGWVLEIDGHIAGYLVVSLQMDECHILNLCVARDYQRQGYGHLLLEQAISTAKSSNISIVYLEVRRSNSRAISLYRKFQFHQIGERKDYYQTVSGNEDALIFAISLNINTL